MPKQRIQRILAAAGVGSRRLCEQFVLDGRVRVNGELLRALPAMADPAVDRITVDDRPIEAEKPVYYMLNKPAGVFCTHNDPAGRRRAVDLLVGVRERVYPVGRLDAESMGLLILTNDGPLTQRLTHPRFGVTKTYRAEVTGAPSENVLAKLRSGVWLAEGKTSPAQVEVIHSNRARTILDITLKESRNREIRRMLAKMGHNVRRLVRIKMGKLSIAKLPVGAFRLLSTEEVRHLKSLATGATETTAGWKPAPRARARTVRRASASSPMTARQAPRRRIVGPKGRGE